MSTLSVGKSVGRVSIRALPDTKDFRRDLLNKLRLIEKTTSIAVTVDKAKVNRQKIRASIEAQLEGLDNIAMDADVAVTISKAKLKRVELRQSIQEQFDQFDNIAVRINAEIANAERFHEEVKRMVRKASRNDANINVNAQTAAATAQMRWLTRDRFVEIHPRVAKAAAAKVAATIAALTGARVAFDWVDKLAESIGRIDKSLPKVMLWTTSLTSLFATLMGAISGIVGVGQGLVSILPALLTLPGLLLNSAASITVLVVALKDAGKQLSVLKGDMSELAEIMRTAFWENARKPIIDLVTGLMPQLRVAFRNVADGVGLFTGEMARAFSSELGQGRLLAIFDHITEGWKVLASGADGFAGALVNLSLIAARYTPRLAAWFVRQANTFDAWLTAISTDGRLDLWMENAIDSMYQLWDATTGIAGVFQGIWKAAKAAGSGGLKGFSETMQRWSDVVNDDSFQRGLTAIFRGSDRALQGIGAGITKVGNLIHGLAPDIEYFIGRAGETLGNLLGGIADALNTPRVGQSLRDLIDGFKDGTAGFTAELPKVEKGVASLLSFAGKLAEQLGPVLGSTLAGVSSFISPLLSYLETEVLPNVGPALKKALDDLQPSLERAGEGAGLLLGNMTELATKALPGVESALEVILSMIDELSFKPTSGFFDPDAWAGLFGDDAAWDRYIAKARTGMYGWFGTVQVALEDFGNGWDKFWIDAGYALDQWFRDFQQNTFLGQMWEFISPNTALEKAADAINGDDLIENALAGKYGVWAQQYASFIDGFGSGIESFWQGVGENWTAGTDAIGAGWNDFWSNLTGGGRLGLANVTTAVQTGTANIFATWAPALSAGWGVVRGIFVSGFEAMRANIQSGIETAITVLASLPGRAVAAVASVGGVLYNSGRALIGGFVNGINSMVTAAYNSAKALLDKIRRLFPSSPAKEGPFSGQGWTLYSGRALVDGFAAGALERADAARDAVRRALSSAAAGLPSFGVDEAGNPTFSAGNTVNITTINPVQERTSDSIRRQGQLIAGGMSV